MSPRYPTQKSQVPGAHNTEKERIKKKQTLSYPKVTWAPDTQLKRVEYRGLMTQE